MGSILKFQPDMAEPINSLYPTGMTPKNEDSFLQQLRKVIKDGLDYLHSILVLFQARTAEWVLSGICFVILVGLAIIFGLTALILFNVVAGIWLAQYFGNPLWAILILAALYTLLAVLVGSKAVRWLKNLKS